MAAAEKAGARRVAALARNNLCSAYSFLGEFEPALEHEEKAVQILTVTGDRRNLMIALGELGLLYDRQGETKKAIPNYERAYQIARELDSPTDAQRHANNLALAFIKSRDWDTEEEW